MKIFVVSLALLLGVATAHAGNALSVKNIVIVHGAFADGSGWEGVYRILTTDGYNVTIKLSRIQLRPSPGKSNRAIISSRATIV